MRFVLLSLVVLVPCSVASQERVDLHIAVEAGTLGLTSHMGPAVAFGVQAGSHIRADETAGAIHSALSFEFARAAGDEQAYRYNSFAAACSRRATGEDVDSKFCQGGTLEAATLELGYAPPLPVLAAVGGGVRYGEEVALEGREWALTRLRPFAFVVVRAPLVGRATVVARGYIGRGMTALRGGVAWPL